MRVGGVEETITVTGESPVVDVQATRQRVMVHGEILDHDSDRPHAVRSACSSPASCSAAGRMSGDRAVRRPDLGIHGSKSSDSVETMGGMSISVLSTGTHQPVRVNPAGAQEVVLDTASGDAEAQSAACVSSHSARRRQHARATFFGAFANGDMQGSN